MFCRKCGNKLDEDAVFCLNCGARVEPENEAPSLQGEGPESNETLLLQSEGQENGEAGTLQNEGREKGGTVPLWREEQVRRENRERAGEGALPKGTVLGGTYEIEGEIGSGGGGVVYRARHLRLQTDVVVKKIKDEVRGKVKSRQEADILKELKHPYLPRVYDFIETADGVYTVMDFIHGENLDEAVKHHGRYPQKQVRRWAEQLGEALDYLHAQKPPIVHSDIKPANIMLTKEGDVCLIDFNISLAMGTAMESAVGISAGFSPPEQYRDPAMYERITHNYTVQRSQRIQPAAGAGNTQGASAGYVKAAKDKTPGGVSGEDRTELLQGMPGEDRTEILQPGQSDAKAGRMSPGRTQAFQGQTRTDSVSRYVQYMGRGIDARSDIYSLGVTLYFLLTGVEPSMDFDARLPVSAAGVPISEGFGVILDKMMELAPENRYQNGGEFLKAIRNSHKLDHRYIVMRRKQTGLQAAALAFLGLGIVTVFGGAARLRTEKNSEYYEVIALAQDAMDQSRFDEAGEILEEARELSDTRVEAYEKEVYLLYLTGNYEECIATGEKYINAAPFQAGTREEKELLGNIYYLVGNAYFEQKDYPNAEKLFSYALEYNAQNGLYYRDYAIALAKLGRIEEAEGELQKGIDKGIGEDSVYMAQGEIARVKGQYDTAAEYLNQTIAATTDPQMKKRAIFLCVDVYKSMGNETVDREIALLEQHMGQFEGNGNLVMTEYLAAAYARKAQVDKSQAQAWYGKSLELFTSIYEKGYVTYQLQENMAILYENMQQFDKAEELLLEMTESYPNRYEVYKRLAYLEADRAQTQAETDRDYRQMLAWYEEAIEKYSGQEQDEEMDRLELMIRELRDGGWL